MISIEKSAIEQAAKGFHIPPQPTILSQLQILSRNDEPDLVKIAELVATDVGLASSILKTVNSPFYGRPRQISNIKQAVLMLGLRGINALVTSLLLKKAFAGTTSLEKFWESSTEVANIMVYIGSRLKNNTPAENLYSTGLFHDCGIPAMALKYQQYLNILDEANRTPGALVTSIENQHFSTNHAVIGYFIAASWRLPKPICELILHHHETDFLHGCRFDESGVLFAILKVAENILAKYQQINQLPEWPVIKDDVFDVLGISELDYDNLEEDIGEMLL